MAFATEHGAADLRLEGYLIVLSAVIANDLETLSSIVSFRGFF
jgi:hypothetical protein